MMLPTRHPSSGLMSIEICSKSPDLSCLGLGPDIGTLANFPLMIFMDRVWNRIGSCPFLRNRKDSRVSYTGLTGEKTISCPVHGRTCF